MFHKSQSIIIGVLISSSLALAQNARISSLGGCNIMDDIAQTFSFPAVMNDYGDNIQASAASSYYGPIIGIKSLGKYVRLGGTWRDRSVLDSSFHSRAKKLLDSNFIYVNNQNMRKIPHLLFGLNFDKVQIGMDIFLELASDKAKQTNDYSTSTPPDTEEKIKGTIFNIGFNLNSRIQIGDKGGEISPLFGMGIPRVKGLWEFDTTKAVRRKVGSEKGISIVGGVRTVIPFSRLEWVLEGFYTFERYQFELTEPAVFADKGPEFQNHYATFNTGLIAYLPKEFLFITQYVANTNFDKTLTEDSLGLTWTETDATALTFNQNISMGVERQINNFWIFDAFTPRAGVSFAIQRNWDITETIRTTSTSQTTTKTITRTSHRLISARPTIGLGISKGKGRLDTYLQLGDWSGVVGGPNVFLGTFTIDFGSKASASGNQIKAVPVTTTDETAPIAPPIEPEMKIEAAPVILPVEPVEKVEEAPVELPVETEKEAEEALEEQPAPEKTGEKEDENEEEKPAQ